MLEDTVLLPLPEASALSVKGVEGPALPVPLTE
jgi:hypothetical protein